MARVAHPPCRPSAASVRPRAPATTKHSGFHDDDSIGTGAEKVRAEGRQNDKGEWMNELVVGVDGSDGSRLALRWSMVVAERAGIPVRAVEAWSYPRLSVISGAGDLAGPEEMDRRTVQDLEALIAEDHGTVPDYVGVQPLRGPAAGALLQTVSAGSVLVLGSRGAGGFAGLLLGSVSRECAAHAPCPVVVVRGDEATLASGGLILVGKDGTDGAAAALEWAVHLGKVTGAQVATVFAWEPTPSEVRPRLAERLESSAQAAVEAWTEDVGNDVHALEVEGDPRDKLVEVAETRKAQLLVVGRGMTGGFGRRPLGHVASAVLEESTTPVAIIPLPEPNKG